MYCKKCGAELLEGIKFCPECGEPVGTKNENVEVVETVEAEGLSFEAVEEQKPHVAKCFTIFGNVGFGLAIASFVCSFIPFLCFVSLEIAPIALVFSILGKKDFTLESKTKKGKIFSILALVFSFIMTIITAVIMAEFGIESDFGLYY